MKKTNRALALAVLIALLVTSLVTLVACGAAKDALEGYQLPVTSVKDDFVLPRVIGENTKVKWKSDNDAIEIVKRRGEDYLAKVTLGDTTQKVTLSVSATGAGSKDFTVNVQALNAMLMANEYVFPQEGLEVSQAFDLEQTFENRGKTATITWSVDEKYKDVISVSADNAKCLVDVPAETTRVEINGTFSYNNAEATKPFTFYVSQPKSPREEINHWYNNSSYTINVSGYVTGIATPYDSSYSNATFYMVSDDMVAGYYLYRAKSNSAADGDALKVGAHVTVTGVLSTDYNGLMEGAAGSVFTVDTDIPAKTPEQLLYALDNDVTSGAPALKWHTGALVSLTNWKIKSIEAASTSKAGTLLTLEKDSAVITVGYNNYMEGFYASADGKPSAELTAIKTKVGTFSVGDTISVTGILSYYSPDFQILPRSEADIVAGTADANATAGSKVKAAITAVNDALKAAGIVDSKGATAFITSKIENKDLPTNVDGVAISYEETFDGSATVIANGKISVTPQDKLQNTTVEVTYTVGGYTTWTYFKVRSQSLDDAGKVAYVKQHLGDEITTSYLKAGEQDLPKADKFSFEGLTITWSIKEASATYATIAASKLTVKLPEEASKFTLVATIKVGSVTDTLEIEITVAAAPQTEIEYVAIDAPVAGTYQLALYQGTLDKWLFATGGISTNSNGDFGETTDDISEAAEFTLAQVTGGWTIKVKGKFLELDSNHRWSLVDASTKAWVWNTDAKVFTFDVSGTVYYLGTYNSFDTISASELTRITGANASAVGKTQFPAYFGHGVLRTKGQIVANEEAKVGDFYLGLYQANLNKWLYATGAIVTNTSGNFGGTTEKPAEAALFTIAGTATDGYTIKVGGKFLELDSDHKFALVDASTQTWKWNAEAKVFTFVVSDVTYYLGTYNSFNTISASEITRITGEKASDVGVSQFPAYFGTIYGYDRAADHQHDWEYTWVDGTRTHTKRCKVAGCPYGTAETEACAIEDNVCDICKHTYPAEAPAHITNKSVADLATTPPADSATVIYEVVGIWHPTGAASDKYGNGYLYDPSTGKRIQIYGMADSEAAFAYESGAYKFTNPQKFQDVKSNFNAGDEIKLGVAYDVSHSNYYSYFIQRTDTSSSFHAYTASVTCNPAEGQGTATLDKTDNLSYDEEVTVTASPASGYKVKSVTANGTELSATSVNVYKFKALPGNNAVVVTFEADDGNRTISLDFTAKNGPVWEAAQGVANTTDAKTVVMPDKNGGPAVTLAFLNCKKGSDPTDQAKEYAYFFMCSGTSPNNAYVANTVAIPGKIVSLTVTTTSSSSASTNWYVTFSTTAKNEVVSTGEPKTSLQGEYTVNAEAGTAYSFFNVTTTSKNGQLTGIDIVYIPNAE